MTALDTALLDRVCRGVGSTLEGERLKQQVKATLARLIAAETELEQLQRERLREVTR